MSFMGNMIDRKGNQMWYKRKVFHEANDKGVVRNMHYSVSHSLCRKYATIILPLKLSRRVKRRAQLLSFGQFRRRLVQTWFSKVHVIGGSEAYTSKQCGACGVMNDSLGGIFKCNSCGVRGDRDVHLRFLR